MLRYLVPIALVKVAALAFLAGGGCKKPDTERALAAVHEASIAVEAVERAVETVRHDTALVEVGRDLTVAWLALKAAADTLGVPLLNSPGGIMESCDSRCGHDCHGADKASCIFGCATGCPPHCCGDCSKTTCGDLVQGAWVAPTVDNSCSLWCYGACGREGYDAYESCLAACDDNGSLDCGTGSPPRGPGS